LIKKNGKYVKEEEHAFAEKEANNKKTMKTKFTLQNYLKSKIY